MVVINNLTFNQDYSCLSISTNEYHKIFNCDPFGEFYSSNSASFKKSLSSSITSEDNKNEVIASIDDETVDGYNPTSYLKMLFSTSLTIIIPQSTSKIGNRSLKVYNLKRRLKICELTFPSSIIDIKLNRKRLVVFLEIGQIYIYDLSCIRLIKVLEINSYLQPDSTFNGPIGRRKSSVNSSSSPPLGAEDNARSNELVGDLSADDASYLVLPLSIINEQTDLFNNTSSEGSASPMKNLESPILKPSDSTVFNSLKSFIEFTQKNEHSSISKKEVVTLEDLKKDSNGWILVYDTIELKPKLIFKAHDSSIAKISISNDHRMIVTASTKGTIIRIFKSEPSPDKLKITQIINLRRGHNLARINALTFNLDNTILGCGSESNTVHFFDLQNNTGGLSTPNEDGYESGSSNADGNDNEDNESRSSEDLNENLANLLISKRPSISSIHNSSGNINSEHETTPEEEDKKGYFSLSTLKKTSKLINNQYTKSIIKKLPYKDYFDNLIWEPPRRSFAFVKLPEYTPPSQLQQSTGSDVSATSYPRHKVEIGFTNNNTIMLASYQTGTFYHYRLPKKEANDDSREECYLINQFNLL